MANAFHVPSLGINTPNQTGHLEEASPTLHNVTSPTTTILTNDPSLTGDTKQITQPNPTQLNPTRPLAMLDPQTAMESGTTAT
ncbi:hypothetical protein E4U43_001963 [Claviceps pusilla]|uniref:Uncharacterized protein n=1 Tax=Claviceps pusilla TaxID=123648 RepID=A0A9P7SYV2_9HYPO|nr:hypothetical protein E4U43_001963 [Claviceps pusilla]